MLFTPIYYISNLIIKFIVRRVNLPSTFLTLAPNLFFLSRSLIRSEGLLPTIRTLRFIKAEISRGGTISAIISNHRLNPIVVGAITRILYGSWSECLSNAKTINKTFKWFLLSIVLSKFSSVIYLLLRLLIGSILAALGIFFSPDLASYSLLKDLSYHFIEFIQNHSPLKFISASSIEGPDLLQGSAEVEEVIPNNNSYTLFSFLFFGLIGGTLGLIVVDYYYHDFVSNIPVVGTFADYINSGINYVYSYFNSGNQSSVDSITPSGAPSAPSVAGEAISRSSSGGSDITITPNVFNSPTSSLITPPSTPEPGINPWD